MRFGRVLGGRGSVSPCGTNRFAGIDAPRTQGQRDRRIIQSLVEGEQGLDVSRRFGLTPARVSQLRRAFKEDWERFGAEGDESEVSIAA